MKATIGIYGSMEKAGQAIQKLVECDFPAEKLSVLGRHEGNTEELAAQEETGTLEVKDEKTISVISAEAAALAVAGTGLGILTGLGVFAIPGFGFLFGAGALVGAIGGFDLGVIGGSVASALTALGMKKHKAEEYGQHLHEGKYLVIVTGEQEEILRAKEILLEHGTHIHVEEH